MSDFALRDANALSIVSWQGAKNCGESFEVTLSGISETEEVQFQSSNCTVFPSTGTGADTYTITVTGAGAYSLTAMTDAITDSVSDLTRDTRSGVAGRADQMPLSISGWGGGDDYYDRFYIKVNGGNTNGAISFQTDGCTVSPAVGTPDTAFQVTVTRVGSYELTAIMDGNTNYNSAYSAKMSGCSSKSNQAPLHIEGWVEDAKSGESFTARIYGGTTSEALKLDVIGCSVTHLSSDQYQVTIDSVGPYALTATRAGNYGYNTVSASASGVSEKTQAHSFSVSGWSSAKNCNDSFQIKISGAASGSAISFVANGCTVSPATGTTDTKYTVTVTSAGEYSLSAVMAETDTCQAQQTRTYHGQSGKGVQNALRVENWIESAPAGSAFEITVAGGSGTGATTLTTSDGCAARLKSGESNVYIISVYPLAGKSYSVSVSKAGDATFDAAAPASFSGKTSGAVQTSLSINGWNESVYSGDSFEIILSGGSGTGELQFSQEGCKIVPGGTTANAYTVTVTALEGDPYSLSVTRAGDDNYTSASITQQGTTRLFDQTNAKPIINQVSVGTYSWVYICGGIVLLFGVVLLIMQIANTPRRRNR